MDKAVAKTQGLTLKDYQKRKKLFQKQSEEYRKTHWVSDLTDAQLFYIVTTQDGEPYKYQGKPLSKNNIYKLHYYKQNNIGYSQWKKTVHNWKKLRQGIEKPLEPFRKLQEEYQELGKRLRSSFLPEQEALLRIQKKINPQLFKGLGSLYNPANPNEFVMDAAFPPTPNVRGMTGTFTYDNKDGYWHKEGKDKDKPIDISHGLNTLMKKHKMSSAIQISDHYLNTFEDPSKADYFVDSFDNPIALAKAVGVTPQKIMEILCREIKVSKTYYKGLEFMSNAREIEELVEEWNTRKTKDAKYPYSNFYRSGFRKEWSDRTGWVWNGYKRFVEQFPTWIKMFNARAYKKGTFKNIDGLIDAQKKIKKAN